MWAVYTGARTYLARFRAPALNFSDARLVVSLLLHQQNVTAPSLAPTRTHTYSSPLSTQSADDPEETVMRRPPCGALRTGTPSQAVVTQDHGGACKHRERPESSSHLHLISATRSRCPVRPGAAGVGGVPVQLFAWACAESAGAAPRKPLAKKTERARASHSSGPAQRTETQGNSLSENQPSACVNVCLCFSGSHA